MHQLQEHSAELLRIGGAEDFSDDGAEGHVIVQGPLGDEIMKSLVPAHFSFFAGKPFRASCCGELCRNNRGKTMKPKVAGYKTARGQFYASLTAMPSHEHGTAKTLHELPDIDMEAIRQIIEAAATEHALGGDLQLCTDLAAKKVQAMIYGDSR